MRFSPAFAVLICAAMAAVAQQEPPSDPQSPHAPETICAFQPTWSWEAEGSGLFAGQISLFEPALKNLEKQDTVAVAHWCDNGDSKLDMLPAGDVAQATSSLEQVLAAMPTGEFRHDRTGELALQKTLQLVVDATRSLPRETLPVVIFLYGDFSAMPRGEADGFVDKLLQTSAIVYGLADSRSPKIRSLTWMGGEQGAIAGYIHKHGWAVSPHNP